jgi:DNA-binding transcriptional LysR family regulator
MMLLDRINLNQLRVFECIFRLGSTVHAASELHLTQSGISQHLSTLEAQLGVILFDRLNRKLVPTAAAIRLYEKTHMGLGELEAGVGSVIDGAQGKAGPLRGTIAFGMPAEFGNNMVLGAIGAFCVENPEVKMRVRYGLAAGLSSMLIDGRLDFAFVDEFSLDRRIHTDVIYQEELSLFASNDYVKKIKWDKSGRETSRMFEELDYVEYLDGEPVLRMWMAHHFDKKNQSLNVRATGTDVHGLSRLILAGVGAGVLPEHHAARIDPTQKKLYRFRGAAQPLKNHISLAMLRDRTQSVAALAAITSLKDHFSKTHPAKERAPKMSAARE